MNLYDFLTGPMIWISFGVFFAGLAARLILYIRGLDWKLDRVAYARHIRPGAKGAFRSVVFWLIPFGTRSWRKTPSFTLMVFAFHLSLLVTPIFLGAHNIMFHQRWDFSLRALPEAVSDVMTLIVIFVGLLFIFRRMGFAHVRVLTNGYDILVLLITIAPFITGFFAHHQVGHYTFWLNAHILSGEVMLMSVPFTKLSHFLLFFLSRIQIGMDFGIKRGGMKNKGMPW